MKFGKAFKKQKVPEWTEAYVDYNGLKHILHEIRRLRPIKQPSTPSRSVYDAPFSGLNRKESSTVSSSGDVENQVINVNAVLQENSRKLYNTEFLLSAEEGGEKEKAFFSKLDGELNKVNSFYKDKVEEVTKEAASLNKQMDALIALRIKVRNGPVRSKTSAPTQAGPSETKGENGASEVEVVPLNHAEVARNPGRGVGREYRHPSLEILDRVKITNTFENPMSTIKGVLMDEKEKEPSFNKEELKEVEARLRDVFSEFYRKLQLLKNYSFMNLSAFSKILKKYEKITSRGAAKAYLEMVDNSYLGSSDEVTVLLNRVETIFVKHFASSNRREGMKFLRPKHKRQKHRVTFFSGFFSGFAIALLIAIILLIQAKKLIDREEGNLYITNIFPLYSFYVYITLHMFLYAANIYFWKRYKINYPFIFGFKQGTEIGYREVFLLGSGLAMLTLATVLVHLHMKLNTGTLDQRKYVEFVPLGLIIVVVSITFCPFKIVYRSSRFFLIRSIFHCICAPLYEVTLPDFFVGDQLTSQVQAIRSFEYYICYYTYGHSERKKNCNARNAYTVFYFIVAVIPYWLRFLQCIRRLCGERDFRHGINGLRYFSTIVAVVIRTAFEQRKKVSWKTLAIVSSGIATIGNTYWDIVMDWGLLQRKSKNKFLRDKLVITHKSVYFIAMALDVLLRFAWLEVVFPMNLHSLRGTTISTVFACLEILRRGIWNFFRLENEHLNNVGKFRAFKSVPLPFTYDDEADDDEDDADENEYEKED